MTAETKPCLICQAAIPLCGPQLCDEHGGKDQKTNHARYASVKAPVTNEAAGLYFETKGDPELGVPDTLVSTFRTNFTECWCQRHWHAYEATSPWCPLCRMDDLRASEHPPETRDAMTATADELKARGWTRNVDEAIERSKPKGTRQRMAKKAKNGEANGADPAKVINCTKMIRVKLTDAECRERGQLAGAKQAERNALEAELDAHKKEQKGKIDALDAEIGTLLAQVYNGHEARPVACRKEYIYRTNTVRVVRADTGEELEARAMLPEELEEHAQIPIQAKGANEENEAPPPEGKKRGRKKRGESAEASQAPAE